MYLLYPGLTSLENGECPTGCPRSVIHYVSIAYSTLNIVSFVYIYIFINLFVFSFLNLFIYLFIFRGP